MTQNWKVEPLKDIIMLIWNYHYSLARGSDLTGAWVFPLTT